VATVSSSVVRNPTGLSRGMVSGGAEAGGA
jgi:hypothetical protein